MSDWRNVEGSVGSLQAFFRAHYEETVREINICDFQLNMITAKKEVLLKQLAYLSLKTTEVSRELMGGAE